MARSWWYSLAGGCQQSTVARPQPFLPTTRAMSISSFGGDQHQRGPPSPSPQHGPRQSLPSPPGSPWQGQTLLAPWHGSGSGPPGRQHPPLLPKLYLHCCCQDAALRKTREKQHSVSALEPGGKVWTGESRGWVWRGRCLRLASLEHLLPALHAGLLLNVLPPVTNITEVLLLGEGWAHG